jgi:hypothetical protein
MRYLKYIRTQFNNCVKQNKPLTIQEEDIKAINLSVLNYNNKNNDIELLDNLIRFVIILTFYKHTESIKGVNYIPDIEQINSELLTLLKYGEFIEQDFFLNNYQTLKEIKSIDYNQEQQNANEIFTQLITKMYNFENIDIINNIKIKY